LGLCCLHSCQCGVCLQCAVIQVRADRPRRAFRSPVFARAGKIDPPSSSHPLMALLVSAGKVCVVLVIVGLLGSISGAGMSGGPVVPQRSSGQWLIALRQHRGRDTIARRSAGACLSACRGTPPACSGFRPAAFGSFVISKPPLMGRFLLASVGKPIAVAAGEQAPGTVQLVTLRPQYTPFAASDEARD